MIRAEKRVDPKEEIAELKKKIDAIYGTIVTAHRVLAIDSYEEEARILDEVHKLLIDLDENPDGKDYGKHEHGNQISFPQLDVAPSS